MRFIKTIPILFLILTLFTCKDSPTDVELDGEFLFKVNVKDTNGNNLESISVSSWNKLKFINLSIPKMKNKSEVNATTTLSFSIPENSIVNFKVYDLGDNLIQTVVDSSLLKSGHYSFQLYHPNNLGMGVFKCLLSVQDSLSSSNLYRDSVYAVLWAPDAEAAKIGLTDQEGNLSSTNKLLFPNVFELPEFIHTNEASPEGNGKFFISDSVYIVLTNNSTNEMQLFEQIISEEINNVNLIWGTGKNFSQQNKVKLDNPNWILKVLDDTAFIPNEYKLFQNYPNPFN